MAGLKEAIRSLSCWMESVLSSISPQDVIIYWGAYVGMPEQILLSGALSEIGPEIITTRAQARAHHGWIMDIYLLRRKIPEQ